MARFYMLWVVQLVVETIISTWFSFDLLWEEKLSDVDRDDDDNKEEDDVEGEIVEGGSFTPIREYRIIWRNITTGSGTDPR